MKSKYVGLLGVAGHVRSGSEAAPPNLGGAAQPAPRLVELLGKPSYPNQGGQGAAYAGGRRLVSSMEYI